MKIKLTGKEVIRALSLPAGKDHMYVFDADHDDCVVGFGLRFRASGSHTWIFQYRYGTGKNKDKRMRLGAWPALSLEKARAEARKLREKVDSGGNPAADRADTKQRAKETFGAEVNRFLARKKATLKPRSYVEVERHLLKNAKPLHDKTLSGIDQRAVAGLLSRVSNEHGPIAANRVRASLSAFLMWAFREGMIKSNPVIATNRADETARDRVLSNAELQEIWSALQGDDYGDIVRLLILTGQRRGEVGGLRWSEVDLENGIITLPPARTKNKLEHIVPLSDAAAALLKARTRAGDRDLVFGQGEGSFQGWSNSKEALDERLLGARRKASGKKAQPLPDWRLHDLRRTAVTGMAKIGVLPHVIEAVVNHISGHKGGIAGVYNHADYLPERTAALARWSAHLLSIVDGSPAKVVPLRTKVPA
jgi:integrase